MKQIFRLENLAKRNALSEAQVERKSALIGEAFLKLPEYEKAKAVMLYFGISHEVRTKGLIEKALAAGKKVTLPVTDFEKKTIVPVEIKSLSELKKTGGGLFEPTGKNALNRNELDLIALPGVAFDVQGTRIGTGFGFYDELLRRTSTKVKLVGLCFEENLEEKLPSESHDVKMDFVVTDKRVVRCRQ